MQIVNLKTVVLAAKEEVGKNETLVYNRDAGILGMAAPSGY
jgi:hypothetical protein